jgi:hypothetical protein
MSDTNELRLKIAELRRWTNFDWLGPRNDYLWADAPPGYEWSTEEKPAKMQVPDWPGDAGAAHDLMVEGCALTRTDPDEWPAEWECSSDHPAERGEYPVMITRYADTPEMAICLWYVEYEVAIQAQAVRDE